MQSERTEAAPAEAENIAVCIRVRPMNERETRSSDANVLSIVPRLNAISLTDESGQPLGGKGNAFQYDEIFDASSDAHGIYNRVAKRIVRSTLGGINGTIFAYGQTSSGKTYTMQGDGAMPFEQEEAANRAGILQLAVEDIFKYIEESSDRDFLLRVSFLEIYNEVVKDLLNPTEKGANLKLREDPRKGVYVECKEEIITNYEDIVALLQTGNQHRTVGQTAMNDRSSRSHSVFRIVIESKEKSPSRRLSEEDVNGAVLVASLNLVDLAGSESLRHTAAEGIRQREAGNINKSLLTLARVINSLASPGGGGQNAPDRYIEETKSTLQFAARAKDIRTTATVNEVLDDQTQLRRLKREVHELKKLVNSEALNALKAENEALISEKNHNRTEMARLMGLILSSASVTKSTLVGKKRKHRGKHKRETWGPGDFPTNLKPLAPLSPNLYPRKRHLPSKENVDPQIIFRVHADIPENALHNSENLVSASVDNKHKPSQASMKNVDDSSKNVLDLFSTVFRSYNDGKVEDPVAVAEGIVNENCASLGESERLHVLELLDQMRTLITADSQYKAVLEGKQREVENLRTQLSEQSTQGCPINCNAADSASKEDGVVEEIMAKLVSAQEKLTKEKHHCQELAKEKANIQQMAAEELDTLRLRLEALQSEFNEAQEKLVSEKRQLEVTLESIQAEFLQPDGEADVDVRGKNETLEKLVQELKASQTVLQLAVAKRDEEIASLKSQGDADEHTILEAPVTCLEEQKLLLREKIREDEVDDDDTTPTAEALSVVSNKEELRSEPSTDQDQDQNGAAEKLAGELQSIMQELKQLQADHEKTAIEKEELQAVTDRINQELEVSQRQGYEMSETLMEKEHIAKVLQAQLDAKKMTISQMQAKHCSEIEALKQSIQGLAVEKESLVARIQQSEAAKSTEMINEEIKMDDLPEHVSERTEALSSVLVEQPIDSEVQKSRSEVGPLSEKLSDVESELAQANERLEAAKDSSELSELRAAFDNLRADYVSLQRMNACSLRERPVSKQHPKQATAAEQHSTKLCDRILQERNNALNADCERLASALEKLTREREDCVDELRALETQLMEISEEKMKLSVTVDEQEMKLRELQREALSSTEEITVLQVKLEEAQSAKFALEDCKAELEENAEAAQAAMQALQVNYDAVVEQLQGRTTTQVSGVECSSSDVKQLQQRFEKEARLRGRLELDVKSYEETLSVLRKDVKDSSHSIADLMDKVRTTQMELAAATSSQELKDKEIARLTDALTKAKEEEAELRFQRQQCMIEAEAKEMALEEKVLALQQQLTMPATGSSVNHDSIQTDMQLIVDKERQELQHKVITLDNQLAEAHQQLSEQDKEWQKKKTMAETEFSRMVTEQQQLREQVSCLQSKIDANSTVSQQKATAQTAELLEVKRAYEEVMKQKEASQHELEISNANWDKKEQNILRKMNSICEQFQEAQEELEEYKKSADTEIRRLHALVEETEARIKEVQRAAKTREEELESQLGEQENWRDQVKSRQEELQEKCEELDDERRVLKEKYSVLETERSDIEQQLQNEIHELSQKCASAEAKCADFEDKLKKVQNTVEMLDEEVEQKSSQLENLNESLKFAQAEAIQYHSKLAEAQATKDSMVKCIEKQKMRIDKLEKVKMTTETLELFRKLKNDRQDLQIKVQKLQQSLSEAERALVQTREDRKQEEEQRFVERNEEVQVFKQHIDELRDALRAEKHQVADIKAEMRAALHDEREKAEHEIQEMQTLLKEKIDRVEQLEAMVASLDGSVAKLQEQKSENVSYLEKENLDLLVENRRLKKQLEPSLQTDMSGDLGNTGTFEASATEAAKVFSDDGADKVELAVSTNDDITAASATARPKHAKAGGFLLSKTELDAIAGDSQDEQKDETRPECHQQ
ncbi:hypothetical protein PHYBOEH_006989 [Phytophthora boehmeriae]|uniref:Kinesin motor domain-containing protein n=1 Tax=Phytophthora boehmeriae TaxID=109152 RepID=A0A8T1X7R7_9STRA|nr:hypothetical protein PHYBOEH_006989 [Phytophthora boehmeriae]